MNKENKILKSINNFAQKMASQIYFRALRDAFVTTVPFLVLAGLMILINNVIINPETGWLNNLITNTTLATWQEIGNKIINGTMNSYSLFIGILISYSLATSRKASNPIFSSIVTVAVLFIVLPLTSFATPIGSEQIIEISGFVPYSYLGTGGIFVSILCSILSTEIFVKLSSTDKLKIRLTGGIPPAVAQSFEALISIILTLLIFSFASFLIHLTTSFEIHDLINKMIQAPLVNLTTSLPGFIILCGVTNLLFALGIHPSGIVNPILEPPLLVAMQQNTEAFANNLDIPNIIVLPFRDLYGHIGGTGSTIALIIAIILFSRKKANRDFAKMAGPLGVFNINEPVIYGFPVVFNPLIMIPFVIGPLISFSVAYFATWAGLVSKIVVFVPWSTPPLINAYMASGGDIRNVILQIVLIALMVVVYFPFLKAYEFSMGVESNNNSGPENISIQNLSDQDSDNFDEFKDFM